MDTATLLALRIPEVMPAELGASVNINRVAYVSVAPFQMTGADIEMLGAR